MEIDINTIFEYISVVASFFIIIYIWPRLVFFNFLKDRSLFFKIFFCVCVSIVLLTVFVLVVGLLNILNQWIFRLCFYLSTLWIICIIAYKNFRRTKKISISNIKHVVRLTKTRIALLDVFMNVVLLVCIVVLTYNFAKVNLTFKSFQFSDLKIHYDWIIALTEGKLFSGGVYPIAMHSVIYALNTIFFIDIYNCMLYIPSCFVILFALSFYYFMKQIFTYKISAVVALCALVIWFVSPVITNIGNGMIFSGIHRLQYALPMEFGLFTIFVAGKSLMLVIKLPFDNSQEINKGLLRQYVTVAYMKSKYGSYSILFMISVVAGLLIHFYTTIIQGILCLSIFIFYIPMLIKKRKISYLILISVISIFIGCLPFVIAFMFTKPSYAIQWSGDYVSGNKTNIFVNKMSNLIDAEHVLDPIYKNEELSIFSNIAIRLRAFYIGGIKRTLYPQGWSIVFSVLFLFSIITFIFYKKLTTSNKLSFFCDLKMSYLILNIASLFYFILYGAPLLGTTTLMESYRLVVILYCMTIPLSCVPLEFLICILKHRYKNNKENR